MVNSTNEQEGEQILPASNHQKNQPIDVPSFSSSRKSTPPPVPTGARIPDFASASSYSNSGRSASHSGRLKRSSRTKAQPPFKNQKKRVKRRSYKNRKRKRRIRWSAVILLLMVFFGFSFLLSTCFQPVEPITTRAELLRPQVQQTADRYGIGDHIEELMAIMHVESAGMAEDVFQSSESLGLDPNSLSTDESIEQGVRFYQSLLEKAARLGLDQDSVFQAYNYGSGFLDYVYENGGHYTYELAEEFAKEHSNEEKVDYPNPIAIEKNGGWRYNYGNMFYVDLIHQYI